jgi:hypothetical protein
MTPNKMKGIIYRHFLWKLCITLLPGIVAVLVSGLFMVSCTSPKQEEPAQLSQEALIKRGKYLTTIGLCHDCHSPKIMTPLGPEPDPDRLFSGHPQEEKIPPVNNQEWVLFSQGFTAAVGPWGVSFAANLTPDDTGIGRWSFQHFKTAIRKGKAKGIEQNRDLLPPMPWPMFKEMSEDDLLAVFTYLKSVKPVKNQVPSPIAPADMMTLNTSE